MKIKAVISGSGSLLAAMGMLLCVHSIRAQQDAVIREHSVSNRSEKSAGVADKIVPVDETLHNLNSVPLGPKDCDRAREGSVQCLTQQEDAVGTVVKQKIATKSVTVKPQSEAENSILEKIVIVPRKVDVVESEAIIAESPLAPQSIPSINEPVAPIDTELSPDIAPRLRDNSIPPISAADAPESVVPLATPEQTENNQLPPIVVTDAPNIPENSDSTLDIDSDIEVADDGSVESSNEARQSANNRENAEIADVDDELTEDAFDLPIITDAELEADELTVVAPSSELSSGTDERTVSSIASNAVTSDAVDVEQVDGDTIVDLATDGDIIFDENQDDIIASAASVSTTVPTADNTASTRGNVQNDATAVEPTSTNTPTVPTSAVDDTLEENTSLLPDSEIAEQLALASQLLSSGQTTQARQLLADFDTSQPLPPQTAQQAAMLANDLNLFQIARRLWEQNVSEAEPYRSAALAALVELSIASGSLAGADIYLQSMLQYSLVPSERVLLVMADYYLDSARFDEAKELIALFSASYPDSKYFDGLLWTRGRLYEVHPNQQNVWGAVQSYRELVAGYPLSNYWEQAQARATYLERHFIDVR